MSNVEPQEKKIFHVPVTKGKGSVSVEINLLNDELYQEALSLGLKDMVNGGMSKITKADIPDDTQRYAEAMRIAQERVEAMHAGTLKLSKRASAVAKGAVPSAVMTEARRIARNLVKDMIKAAGIKQTSVGTAEITKAANVVIERDPSIIRLAEANLANRGAPPAGIDITALGIAPDPKLVAKAEAKKAEAKAKKAPGKASAGVLSAAQAGKVAPRVTH